MAEAMLAQIMATQHFCNLHREDDPGTRFINTRFVLPNRDDPDVFLKVALGRFTNERQALAEIDWLRPFDLAYLRGVLEARQARGETVFRTKAYKPPMPPEVKGMGTLQCLFEVVLGPMARNRDYLRPRVGDTLEAFSDRLRECHGVGTFHAGQLIGDLKVIPPLRSATDWWTYVVPGPGSERGLNRLFDRPLNKKWPEPQFRAAIAQVRSLINAELAKHGIAELDGQNTNNFLCEGDKFLRAVENGGKPSRKYSGAETAKPAKKPKQQDAEQVPETPPVEIIPAEIPAAETPAAAESELLRLIAEDMARDAAETAPQPPPKPEPNKASPPPGGNGHQRHSSAGHSPHGTTGTPRGQSLATWIYDHPDLPPPHYYLLVEKRIDAAGNRNFYQKHWAGGRWNNGVKGTYAERKIPYQLGALKAALAADPNVEVQITEGEKDTDTLTRLGFTATTNPGGAEHWSDDLTSWLRALGVRRIVLHEDHDKAGIERTAKLTAALSSFAAVRVARYPDVPEGEDVTYWIDILGHTKAELEARIAAADPAKAAELDEWDAGELLSGAAPEPRQWLIARYFCRTFLSGLVAPGDAGKTTLRLTQAIELATGRELLGQRVYARSRVLVLCFEDDRPELHRRLLAICKHHSINPAELKGWLFCRNLKKIKLAERDSKGGQRQVGALDGMLRRAIERGKYDLVILDPFVKLHALTENDNPDMDFVCELLIDIAQHYTIAIDSPAHTHKGEIAAGDADARRGGSAQRDAGRLDYTLTVMSEAEAKHFGIPPDQRKAYVRLDKAKANIVRVMKAVWFQLVSVRLENPSELYPDGDEVQAIERWTPPETWAEIEGETLNAILDDIEAGMPNGQRYSKGSAATKRAAWRVVQKYCPNKPEAQCREIIKQWSDVKVLFEASYDDPVSRKPEQGLRVDGNKRPQY